MPNESPHFKSYCRLISSCGLLLTGSGSIILAWVGWLVWYDITTWDKDITQIFFGSRIGEAISLGIGMKVIYYFLTGLTLLILGSLTFLRSRSAEQLQKENVEKVRPHVIKPAIEEEKFFSGCLHSFGYLASRPSNAPIPEECIICQRLGDCMVATIKKEMREIKLH